MCHMADGRWWQRQMWQHSLGSCLVSVPGTAGCWRPWMPWMCATFNSYRSAKQQHNAMHDEMSNHTS